MKSFSFAFSIFRNRYLALTVAVSLLIGVAIMWGWQTSAQRRRPLPVKPESVVTVEPNSPQADGDLDATFITTDRPGSVPAGVSRIQFPNGAANSGAGSDAGSESPVFV